MKLYFFTPWLATVATLALCGAIFDQAIDWRSIYWLTVGFICCEIHYRDLRRASANGLPARKEER